MGKLLNQHDAKRQLLQARHLVGRSPACALCISTQVVSGEHAVLSWTGEFWLLRDLGSRNGTYLNGRLAAPGAGYPLEAGNTIVFGTHDNSWLLEDDSPPCAMAIPEGAPEHALEIRNGLLTLPSEEHPLVTIFSTGEGWLAEEDGGSKRLDDGDALRVAGVEYRILLPEVLPKTQAVGAEPTPDLLQSQLILRVSQDEEFVLLEVHCEGKSYDFENRSHHYLLVLLARARFVDRAAGHPAQDRGWLHREQILQMLQTTAEQLNLMIFRLRQQFAGKGFRNAASIIERRQGTGQVRLGVADTKVRKL